MVHVPLRMQIKFEFFITKESLYSKDEDGRIEFVKKKIRKLLVQFEGLMKIKDKKYTGVLQELHTKLLMMGYHDINTVFQIGSDTCSTLSLSKADQMLKSESEPNLCHFNVYLKKNPLAYVSGGKPVTRRIGLRDCHNTVNLDNFVRLNWKRDPTPGESRSSQVCTIPITIGGVPKDADICQSWHSQDCDQNHPECSCKVEVPLNKDDFLHKILNLLPEEKEVLGRFKKLSTWKVAIDWKTIDSGMNIMVNLKV